MDLTIDSMPTEGLGYYSYFDEQMNAESLRKYGSVNEEGQIFNKTQGPCAELDDHGTLRSSVDQSEHDNSNVETLTTNSRGSWSMDPLDDEARHLYVTMKDASQQRAATWCHSESPQMNPLLSECTNFHANLSSLSTNILEHKPYLEIPHQLQQRQQETAQSEIFGTDHAMSQFSAAATGPKENLSELFQPNFISELFQPNFIRNMGLEAAHEAQLEDPKVELAINVINDTFKRLPNRTAAGNAKGSIRVMDVISILLLDKRLAGVISFCTKDGVETGHISENFKVLDTKTMGRIWQLLKGNNNAKFDTFARAMRASRERRTGLFDFVESGPGTRKKIYRFGPEGQKELIQLKMILQPTNK